MTTEGRFERLASGAAGGTKLCAAASDDDRFRRGLEHRFGAPDVVGDAAYSYSIRDRESGLEFEAYSAQSGPAYGGDVACFEQGPDGYRLRDSVRAALDAFDAWIDAGLTSAE